MSVKLDYNKFFRVLEEAFCKKCPYYDKECAKEFYSLLKGTEDEDNTGLVINECCKIEEFDRCLIYYLTGIDYEGWE